MDVEVPSLNDIKEIAKLANDEKMKNLLQVT
jgi:hypothetical protein